VVIQVPPPPLILFREHYHRVAHAQPARPPHSAGRGHLRCASPLRFGGPSMRLGSVDMDFEYAITCRRAAQHRLRGLLQRLHGGGCYPVPACRHWSRRGASIVTACPRRVESSAARNFPTTLPELGTEGSRRTAHKDGALEGFRKVILAGDIGGTKRAFWRSTKYGTEN